MSSQRRLRPSWRALACAAASVLALLLFAGHERAPALFDTEAGWERGAGVEYVARLGESGGHRPRPWQPLIFAPRSWAPGGAYVNEEEEVYFGPLSAHKFAMHPASFADGTAWEVAKLWTAPEAGGAGRASASGVVTLTEPGGAGLLFRLLLGESVLLERAVNDSAPSLDFAGLEFDVSFGDKVAFALSVAGPSHDFCGSWTRFVVKAAGPRRRRGPPRWPRALYAGRGGAGLEGATPLLPPPPAPPPQPPRRCDALLLEGPPARLFCLPTVFIVGAAYCGASKRG